METLSFLEAKKIPLITKAGDLVGYFVKALVREEKLELQAFLVTGESLGVYTGDVSFRQDRFIIESKDRVFEITVDDKRFQKYIDPIGSSVVTESGTFLGDVGDFEFNPELLFIKKLKVVNDEFFEKKEVLVDRDDVIKVTKDLVIVRDLRLKKKKPERKLAIEYG